MYPNILQSNINLELNNKPKTKPLIDFNYNPSSPNTPKESETKFNTINIVLGIIGIILILGGFFQITTKYVRVDGIISDVTILSVAMNQQDNIIKKYPIKISYSYKEEEKTWKTNYSSVLPPNKGQSIDVYVNEMFPSIISLGNQNILAGIVMVVIGIFMLASIYYRIINKFNIVE